MSGVGAEAGVVPSLHHPSNPPRPPSRQSTRIITPVRTDPNFIRPHADSRKSIAQVRRDQSEGLNSPSKSTVPCTSKSTRQVSNKRRRSEVDGSRTNSEQNHILMDLTQDSDQENSKVKKPRKTRVRKDSEFGLDAIELYFHKPVYANGDKPPTPERDAEDELLYVFLSNLFTSSLSTTLTPIHSDP
ncbi:hypothetical protein PSHT_09569 [Puccinia striiformis]|uniref:Uncharacterized protein n=1 Tax=Puccinia striiformis TaxID=27350 RepID=A0A2S4VFX4_9BASI|nr:hypothetical protein PSHT_09569 [Puccinia striiformis]